MATGHVFIFGLLAVANSIELSCYFGKSKKNMQERFSENVV